MTKRLMRWKYPLACAWLAALAAVPLLQVGQGAVQKWYGGFVWEAFGLLVGLIIWHMVRGSGIVATVSVQRVLAVAGTIGVALLALSVAVRATDGVLIDAALQRAGVSGLTVAGSGVAGALAFASAFLYAYCCSRMGRMRSLEAVVALPVRSLVDRLPGVFPSVTALIGGVLFAAVLFWGYVPEGEEGAYSDISWVAATVCFALVLSFGMLALCPDEADKAKAAATMRGRIRTTLDKFEEDDTRVRFKAFYTRIVASWVAGACLWVLASGVSALPETVSDPIRWVLAMMMLANVVALALAISHIRAAPHFSRKTWSGSRADFEGGHAGDAASGSGVASAGVTRTSGQSSLSASCVAACETTAAATSMPFDQTTASATDGQGSDVQGQGIASVAHPCTVSGYGLTRREEEAVAWVIAGLTSAQAAKRMGLKASTVRVYAQRAYRKLGTADCHEARALFASQDGGSQTRESVFRENPLLKVEKHPSSTSDSDESNGDSGKHPAGTLTESPGKGIGFDIAMGCSASGDNGSRQLAAKNPRRIAPFSSHARLCASAAAALGLAVVVLLFVPALVTGGIFWVGEGAYAGCAAALFLVSGANLLARKDAGEEDAGLVRGAKDIGYVLNPHGTCQPNRGGMALTGFSFACVVRESRVAAYGFGALTAVLGCALAALLWFGRSAFGVWPAIVFVTALVFTVCAIGWGSTLMLVLCLPKEDSADRLGTRLLICVGCCATVAAALLLQAVVPWAYLAVAALATIVFAGLSVAAASLREVLDTPPEASHPASLESDIGNHEASALALFPGEALLAAHWFTAFCAAMGFMWSRLWEGRTTSFLGLGETLFAFAVVMVFCIFFAAQVRGRSRVAVLVLVFACGILYMAGSPAVMVYAVALLPALFVVWCSREGLFQSLSLQRFSFALAIGAVAGLAYSVVIERSAALWQELYAVGIVWVLSFVQLAMAALMLLAVVGLGMSCRFVAIERRARMAARELEAGAGKDQVRSYLVGRGLNPLQVDVVVCIVRGMTSAQMADALSYSAGSINTARFIAYRVLGVHNRAHLAELLVRETGLTGIHEAAADRRTAGAGDMLRIGISI